MNKFKKRVDENGDVYYDYEIDGIHVVIAIGLLIFAFYTCSR